MKGTVVVVAILATLPAVAQNTPTPEECIAPGAAPVTVTHAGKSYRLASEDCRSQFLSDPERYAQLYDALLELKAAGATIAPAVPSLVPS